MFVSGKLFAALIAAAVIGVTGSPMELEKRDTVFTLTLCIASPSGFGENCSNWTANQGDCNPLEGYLDKALTSIDTGGSTCTLSTYVWVSLLSCFLFRFGQGSLTPPGRGCAVVTTPVERTMVLPSKCKGERTLLPKTLLKSSPHLDASEGFEPL